MICKINPKSLNGQMKLKKAFNKIKKLLVCWPVLKAPTPDGLLRLKSDTLREGVGILYSKSKETNE